MDFFSHFFLGFLISALFFNILDLDFFIFAAIVSMLPDFDIFLYPLIKRIKNKYFLSHRGGSHSYVIGLILAPMAGGIFYIITKKSFILALIVGFIFYSMHITFDLFSTQRIPIFYPFSKKEYKLSIDNSLSSFLLVFSIVNLVTFLIFYIFWPIMYFSSSVWMFYFTLYLIYFIYKAITRIWFKIKLPENCVFIPGNLPFIYFIYETFTFDNHIVFRLTKKFQFVSKSNIIIENAIKTQSEEMFYFEKTKQISKEYRYFLKMDTIFPIIQFNKDTIEVTLFLAQSYFNGYAYFIRIIFNKFNTEVLKVYKGVSLQRIFAASYFNCVLNKWIIK